MSDDPSDIDHDHLVETPESLRDDDPEAMPMDRGSEATDRPLGAEKFGTTHAEEVQGDTLDGRLRQERPDTGEHDPVDDVVGRDRGGLSAEEAALHVEDPR